jgi:nucleotidyltransferase substrate binding protein (TIGR01987 family)
MEGLKLRYTATQQALGCLQESISILFYDRDAAKYHKQIRNSAIQCFEFSVDTLWKFLKEYVSEIYGAQVNPPTSKSTFKVAMEVGLISKDEIGLLFDIVDDRNMTSHTYKELLAEEIAQRLPNYYKVMAAIIERITILPAT